MTDQPPPELLPKRRKFSREFKGEAVKLAKKRRGSVAQASRPAIRPGNS